MEAATADITRHCPVLLDEIVESFAHREPKLLFDGTLGGGGHAETLLEKFETSGFVGFDRDAHAIARCKSRLKAFENRIWLTQASFAELHTVLSETPPELQRVLDQQNTSLQFDCMLLDLGISSDQLDSEERGFSFSASGPLDMRMDQNSGATAADILNEATQGELSRIFRLGGLRDLYTALAKEVIASRPVNSTAQFADICVRALRRGKLQRKARVGQHPATIPFQALRIAVNREYEAIEQFLAHVLEFLAPGGRLAIISFHSAEDKLVAKTLRAWSRTEMGARKLPSNEVPKGALLTKKAIVPTETEIAANPRARSARLRVFEKSAESSAKEVEK